MSATTAREAALREALLPQVEDLVTALVDLGMTRERALSSIRWASYRLTRPDDEVPVHKPYVLHVFGGGGVQP